MENLNEKTVKELKTICKELGITGYSDKTKLQLIYAIEAVSQPEPEVENPVNSKKINQQKLSVTVDNVAYTTLTSALKSVKLNIKSDWLKVRALLKKSSTVEYEGHTFIQH